MGHHKAAHQHGIEQTFKVGKDNEMADSAGQKAPRGKASKESAAPQLLQRTIQELRIAGQDLRVAGNGALGDLRSGLGTAAQEVRESLGTAATQLRQSVSKAARRFSRVHRPKLSVANQHAP